MPGAHTTQTCPHCGQPLPSMRLGIRLNPIKARIFDALKRAGPDGIETEMLFDLIYAGRPTQRTTLKSQIWQLNALLREAETGLRIRGDRGGDPTSSRCFRMVKEKRG